jgi:hypothetical protein
MIQVNLEKIPGGIRFKDEDWNFSFQFLTNGYQFVSPDTFVDVELRDEIVIFDTKYTTIDSVQYPTRQDWIQALYA